MKKLSIAILSVAIIGAAASCQKSKKADSTPVNTTTKSHSSGNKISDDIGNIHNSTLAYCYTQYSQSQPGSVTKDQALSNAIAYCAAYLSVNNPDLGWTQQQILDFYNNNNYTLLAAQNLGLNDQDQQISNDILQLPADLQPLTTRVFSAVDAALTYADLQTTTNGIIADAQNLPDIELQELQAFINVELASWSYWNDEGEFTTWQNTFLLIRAKTTMPKQVKAAIKGDIEGTVTGALAGGLAGALVAAPLVSAWETVWSCF